MIIKQTAADTEIRVQIRYTSKLLSTMILSVAGRSRVVSTGWRAVSVTRPVPWQMVGWLELQDWRDISVSIRGVISGVTKGGDFFLIFF